MNGYWQLVVKYLLVAGVFSLVVCFSLFKIDDPDTSHYVANGKYILEYGFSHPCTFSYASNTCQTAYSEWLFHVLTYGVHAVAGFNGLVVLQMLLALAIFLIIYWYLQKQGRGVASILLLLTMGSFVAMERFMLRADLFSILLAVGLYICLEATLARILTLSKKQLYIRAITILLLQLLWANTHGSFPLGWAIVGAFLAAEITLFLWGRWQGIKIIFFSQNIKFLLTVLSCSLLVSFMSPYGLKAFLWPFQFYFGPAELRSQLEFLSPFAPADFQRSAVFVYEWLLTLSGVVLVLTWKKIKYVEFFVLVGLAFLSVSALRYMALFAVFAVLILPRHLDVITSFLKAKILQWGRIGQVLLHTFSLVCAMLFLYVILRTDYALVTNRFYIADQRYRRFGFGVSEIAYPEAAAQFVLANNLSGHMFNDYGSGGYLNWKLYPQRQTYIDGHTYTASLLAEYKSVIRGGMYKQVASTRQVHYFLLDYANGDAFGLIGELAEDPDWVPVYADDTSIIFVARVAEHTALIEKYAIDFAKDVRFGADSPPSLTQPANATIAFANRGALLVSVGQKERAVEQFKKAVQINPLNYVAEVNLGKLELQLGKKDSAKESLEHAIKTEQGFAPAHFYLGAYYAAEAGWIAARDEFLHTLAINSEYINAHYNLGIAYEALKDSVSAAQAYRDELVVQTGNSQVESALRRLK